MARPLKKGLGYFPLDTDLYADRKILRLLHRHGCQGVCVFLATLCEIYRERGYYAAFDSDLCFDMAILLRLEEQTVEEIILYCVEIRLFDRELLEYRQVLTSAAIQRRFKEISRRLGVKIDPELEVHDERVSATETPVIDTEMPVFDTEMPVSVAKTPENGNGNININENQHGKDRETDETRFSCDDGAASRRAELLRMAKEATRGC